MPLNQQENFNLNQLDLIQSGSEQYSFPSNTGDYIKLNIYDDNQIHRAELNSQIYDETNVVSGNFKYLIDATNTVRVKPNDILNNLGYITGNYNIDFNFLRNIFFDLVPNLIDDVKAAEGLNLATAPRFFITEISPTRKEVRLLARKLNSDFLPGGSKEQTGTPTYDNYPLDSNFQNMFKFLFQLARNTRIFGELIQLA